MTLPPEMIRPQEGGGEVKFSQLRDALIGPNRRRENMMVPNGFLGATMMKNPTEVMIESFFESCVFRTTMSTVVGFGLGAAIGLFSASVGPELAPIDQKQQTVKEVLKEMKGKTLAYAKNFAALGAMFAATECTLESVSYIFAYFDFHFSLISLPLFPNTVSRKIRLEEWNHCRRNRRRSHRSER